MTTTLSRDGRLVIPKSARQAAGVEPGQVFDVQCAGSGLLVLRRARKRAAGPATAPLLNIEPFPAGTLAAIYLEADPGWEAVEKAAALAQPKPRFDE